MINQFTKFVNNLFIEGNLNLKNEPADNFEIVIYSPDTNIAYTCVFLTHCISIPNTNLEKIYKMISNALDLNPNYIIKWELANLNFTITYQHDIFTFTQVIMLNLIDVEMVQLKYQLFQYNQKVIHLTQHTVSIKKFCELTTKFEEMKKIVETLKEDINLLKVGIVISSNNTYYIK